MGALKKKTKAFHFVYYHYYESYCAGSSMSWQEHQLQSWGQKALVGLFTPALLTEAQHNPHNPCHWWPQVEWCSGPTTSLGGGGELFKLNNFGWDWVS